MRGTGRTRLSQPHSTHHDDGKQDFRLKFGGALEGPKAVEGLEGIDPGTVVQLGISVDHRHRCVLGAAQGSHIAT